MQTHIVAYFRNCTGNEFSATETELGEDGFTMVSFIDYCLGLDCTLLDLKIEVVN